MRIGVPREIKRHEYRVSMTPSCVKSYIKHGHEVFIESSAGLGSGFSDAEYSAAGAYILTDKAELFAKAELIVKVKEPLPEEYGLLRPGLLLFTYLHLAANRELAKVLMERQVSSIAYETIELSDHSLPCLVPMSEIAGRLAVQEGAKYLEKEFGGRGVLLPGVPGISRGQVAILGAGTVGMNACKIASGIGASVTILDINAKRLAYIDDIFGSRVTTLYATEANIAKALSEADVVIGAVLIPGESAPKLIRREHLKTMKQGAVIVDVVIDQGGCAETSRPTTHDDPVYLVDGIVHYCVANMPGSVAFSSTSALTNTTITYGLLLADRGLDKAMGNDAIRKGLNTYGGFCVHEGVARSCGLAFTPLEKVLG